MNHTNQGVNPYLEQALAEHHELHRVVEEVVSLLDSVAPRDASTELTERAVYRIRSLGEKLQQHFAQEEEGGYLEEAIARVPSLAPQAAVLQRQHAEFTKLAEGLLVGAKTATTPAACWTALQAGFKVFSKRLLAHEAAENALLQRAYNVDLGLE